MKRESPNDSRVGTAGQSYQPVSSKVDFPAQEERILAFWKERSIFKQSIERRRGGEEFIFYDGPPFATGLPHFGHFVPGTIKDIIPRYQTMKGKVVERRFGWDCHGLPVEHELEKQLGISGRGQIEDYGIGRFNEGCRRIVLRYTAEWREIIDRMGRWVDFDNDYKTMDPDYMESIWWVIKQLWDKRLLYQGYYILPYSPGLATPISNFEVKLGGYRDVDDPAITVRFRLRPNEQSRRLGLQGTVWFLAWTTTPWTLPSNLGLAVGPTIEYALVRDGDEYYLLAADRLPIYYREAGAQTIDRRFTGANLTGLRYDPLFPYFASLAEQGAFRVRGADFVSTNEGTGIVHTAPGFGEEDYRLFKGSGLPTPVPLDDDCRFTDEVPDFEGLFVKEADRPIIEWLKREGALVRRESHRHPYPFCYRTNRPLIYRAVSSWFVNVERIKADMIAANDTVRWVPEHLRRGRFGKWLQEARDWSISRNRYWGNPIPIWKCDGSDYMECIGSRAMLAERTGEQVSDLHRHFIDHLTWPSPDGTGTMRRIPEVLDCWFESGAMPYGQRHGSFERTFPADFICEGIDQTRGWFYTLIVLGAALFRRPAFKSVVVNGLVLAEDGKKMSKSRQNYTDPKEIIKTYGADALRLFLMHSSVVRAEDLRYSDNGVKGVLKSILIPLWNSYSFFITYANIDGIRPIGPPERPTNPLDRWLLSESERLTEEVTTRMDAYDLQQAIDPIVGFIDALNNWYIRRSRRRFWRSENSGDKVEAYQTLYATLLRIITLAAPFIPFLSEAIWRNLRVEDDPESVHLLDFPIPDGSRRDPELERRMRLCRLAVSMAHSIRRQHNLKIRQPLRTLHLVTTLPDELSILQQMEEIIREETNVKRVQFHKEETSLVEYRAKPNYPLLGRRLGKKMKGAAARIAALSSAEIEPLLAGEALEIDIEGTPFRVTSEAVDIRRVEREGLIIQNEGSLTVAIDPKIDEELLQEGIARDIVRMVQILRKESGLAVTDRIELSVAGKRPTLQALATFRDYATCETLATNLRMSEASAPFDDPELTERFGHPTHWKQIQIDTTYCWIGLQKTERFDI